MTTPQTTPKVDPQRYVELRRQGLNSEQIAKRLGVSAKTACRWLHRLLGDGWQAIPPLVTAEQKERILQLAREGVPDGWIAEEVGLEQSTVSEHRRLAGEPAGDDWKLTRLEIQRSPTLFALHREFAPVALRRS